MTAHVRVYSGVSDRLSFACRLLRKAQWRGAQVAVCGALPILERLDVALWTFEPLAFVPHALWVDPQTPAPSPRTSIVLLPNASHAPHRDVLLVLSEELPAACTEFDQVLDVVSGDPAAVRAGRQRYRLYLDWGLKVRHESMGARSTRQT